MDGILSDTLGSIYVLATALAPTIAPYIGAYINDKYGYNYVMDFHMIIVSHSGVTIPGLSSMVHAQLVLLGGRPFCHPAEPDLAGFGDQHVAGFPSFFSN